MGGCVASVMEQQNASSMEPHPIISGYRKYGQQCDVVPGTETPNASSIYRFPGHTDAEHAQIKKEYYEGPNWVEIVQTRAKEMAQKTVFRYRVCEKVEKKPLNGAAKGPAFDFFHLSNPHNVTYHDFWTSIESFGRGLRRLGLGARQTVAIYEETRWEWLVSIYGIWTQEMVASTVYANLGEDALAYALNETESSAIICNGKALKNLIPLLQKHQLHPILIYLDAAPADLDTADFTVVSWEKVVQEGASSTDPVTIPTNNDTTALIMYTSGTTGDPKGVVHTHGSIAAGIRALNHRLLDLYKPPEKGETYCAYLPLAHILEFSVVNIFINRGTVVAFGNPRTLTDRFAIPCGDLTVYTPTVIIGVPRIFDTIKKSVEGQLPHPGSFKHQIFEKAYEARRGALVDGKDTPYWNDKAFGKARKVLGGGVYGMLSGGGPLSAATQEFINVVTGGPLIIQGWGLTETVCCGTVQRLGDLEPNCVGQILETVEVKLLDTEDFKHTDTPEPRGELLVRGPFLFKGYYKQEKLTKEVLDADGWFHTGDVGSITANGAVRLVGRVKALAKNVLGEYIALEALEALYAQHPLALPNGVCVLVNPAKSYICALVLTDEAKALKFAKQQGLDGAWPELINRPEFSAKAAASMTELAAAAKRRPFEFLKCVRVLADEWTPENDVLTAAMKLKRRVIDVKYAETIAELFSLP